MSIPTFSNTTSPVGQKSEAENKDAQVRQADAGVPFSSKIVKVDSPNDSMEISDLGGSRPVKILHPYLGLNAWHRVGPEPEMFVLAQTRLDTKQAEAFAYYQSPSRPAPEPNNLRISQFYKGKDPYRPIESGEQELSSIGFAQIYMSRRPYLDLRGGYVRAWYDQDRLEAGAKAATHRLVLNRNISNQIGDEFRIGVVTRPGAAATSSDYNSPAVSSTTTASNVDTNTSPATFTSSEAKTSTKPTTATTPANLDRRNRLRGVHPELANRVRKMAANLAAQGINIFVTSGYRSHEEQDSIYYRGRTDPSGALRPGPILTNARGGESNHNFGLAVDVSYAGNPLPSVGAPPNSTWKIIGNAGKAQGLVWGGDWKFLDIVHFEMTAGFSVQELQRFYGNGGIANVWSEIDKRLNLANKKTEAQGNNTAVPQSPTATTQENNLDIAPTQSAADVSPATSDKSHISIEYIKTDDVFAREFMYVLNSASTTVPVLVDHREGNVIDDEGTEVVGSMGEKLRYRKFLYTTTNNKRLDLQVDVRGNLYVDFPDDASRGIEMNVPKGSFTVDFPDSKSNVTWNCGNVYNVLCQNDVKVQSYNGNSLFLGTNVKLGTEEANESLILGNTYQTAETRLFSDLKSNEDTILQNTVTAMSSLGLAMAAAGKLQVQPAVTGPLLYPVISNLISCLQTLIGSLSSTSGQKSKAYSTFTGSYSSYLSTVVKTG